MPYEFYKVLHITGLILVFSGIAGVFFPVLAGHPLEGKNKRFAFITHGIGLLLMFVSGFGLLARLGIAKDGLPHWIYAKLVIWLFLGGAIALAKRKGQIGWPLFVLFVGVGITAAIIAVIKPF